MAETTKIIEKQLYDEQGNSPLSPVTYISSMRLGKGEDETSTIDPYKAATAVARSLEGEDVSVKEFTAVTTKMGITTKFGLKDGSIDIVGSDITFGSDTVEPKIVTNGTMTFTGKYTDGKFAISCGSDSSLSFSGSGVMIKRDEISTGDSSVNMPNITTDSSTLYINGNYGTATTRVVVGNVRDKQSNGARGILEVNGYLKTKDKFKPEDDIVPVSQVSLGTSSNKFGNTHIGGIIYATNTTDASTGLTSGGYAQGSLQVSGGVGIKNSINIGDRIVFRTSGARQGSWAQMNSKSAISLPSVSQTSGTTYAPWVSQKNSFGGAWAIGQYITAGNSAASTFSIGIQKDDTGTNNISKWDFYPSGKFSSSTVSVTDSTTDSASTSSGALTVAGGVGIGKKLYVGSNASIGGTLSVSGVVSITNTTEASSTSTGALRVTGGVGIAKKLYVGSSADASSTGGALVVSGGIKTKNLYTDGGADTIINGINTTNDGLLHGITLKNIDNWSRLDVLRVSTGTAGRHYVDINGSSGVRIWGNGSKLHSNRPDDKLLDSSLLDASLANFEVKDSTVFVQNSAISFTNGIRVGKTPIKERTGLWSNKESGDIYLWGQGYRNSASDYKEANTYIAAYAHNTSFMPTSTTKVAYVNVKSSKNGTNDQWRGDVNIYADSKIQLTAPTTTIGNSTNGYMSINGQGMTTAKNNLSYSMVGGDGNSAYLLLYGGKGSDKRYGGFIDFHQLTSESGPTYADSGVGYGRIIMDSGDLKMYTGGGRVIIDDDASVTGALSVKGALSAQRVKIESSNEINLYNGGAHDTLCLNYRGDGNAVHVGKSDHRSSLTVHGVATISDTTNATSSSGALVSTGGVKAKNLYITGGADTIINGHITNDNVDLHGISLNNNRGWGQIDVARVYHNGDGQNFVDINGSSFVRIWGNGKSLSVNRPNNEVMDSSLLDVSLANFEVSGSDVYVQNSGIYFTNGTRYNKNQTSTRTGIFSPKDWGAMYLWSQAYTSGATHSDSDVIIASYAPGNSFSPYTNFGSRKSSIRSRTVWDGSAWKGVVDMYADSSINISTGTLGTDAVTKITNTTDSTASTTGALKVSGGVGIAKKLYVGSNASIGGTLSVVGATTISSTTDSSSSTTGVLKVSGGVGIAKKLYVGSNASIGGTLSVVGATTISSTTASTSTTTGALKVSGGAGIAGNLYIGGMVYATKGTQYSTIKVMVNTGITTYLSGYKDYDIICYDITGTSSGGTSDDLYINVDNVYGDRVYTILWRVNNSHDTDVFVGGNKTLNGFDSWWNQKQRGAIRILYSSSLGQWFVLSKTQ